MNVAVLDYKQKKDKNEIFSTSQANLNKQFQFFYILSPKICNWEIDADYTDTIELRHLKDNEVTPELKSKMKETKKLPKTRFINI